MRIKQKLFLLLMSVLFVVSINAQDETIRVETDLVTVNIALTDAKEMPVKGLRLEQFELFDNNVKQQISHFSAAKSPVSFGIVYDMHPTTTDRTKAVLDSLKAFTKELGAVDRFFMIAFNDRGNLNIDFIPTVEQVQNQLKRSDPRSLYDAIFLASDKLADSKNLKRTLLIISDSADGNSLHSFDDLSKHLKGLDLQIYAMIFDETEMKRFSDITEAGSSRRRIASDATKSERIALEGLTIKSGGTSSFPLSENAQDLYEFYQQINSEMRDFYTLSFYPKVSSDGKWHELKIGLRGVKDSKKFALTYRQGYQSSRPRER